MAITLLSTVEWAKRFVGRRPQANGNSLEPAVSNANIVLQTILGPPFRWRWNRVVVGFVAVPGQQDYTIFTWNANTTVNVGYVLIDSNGNSQSATAGGTTGLSEPIWNDTIGSTTTDGSVTWTNLGSIAINYYSRAYRFGWIENASVLDQDQECNNSWKEISPKIGLALDSVRTIPHSISAEFDDPNGNVTFRLMPVPDKNYPISITIQQAAPIMTGLDSVWSPIPDNYSRLYNWGFLALVYLFHDDPRFAQANQKFISNLLATNNGLTETERNIVLNNWQQVTGAPMIMGFNNQQGMQGKGNL